MIYLTLFFEFIKIGLFTFGGGYTMIPLLKETIFKYQWMDEDAFYSFLGVAESTPGPIAINMATYVGASQGGLLGAICSTIGVVLPSFIIIIIIAAILSKLLEKKGLQAFLKGIQPVIAALILEAGLLMFLNNIGLSDAYHFSFDFLSTILLGIIILTYFGIKFIFKKKIGTITLIIYAAVLGIIVNVIIK